VSAGPVKVTVFGKTDLGRTRDHNEDTFLVADLSSGNSSLLPEVREHEIGRGFTRKMDGALGLMKSGDASHAQTFVENARGYVGLLVNHIDKEEHVLFVMADQLLGPAAQADLAEGFERVEREETGAGVHEKYHALLHRLRDAYL